MEELAMPSVARIGAGSCVCSARAIGALVRVRVRVRVRVGVVVGCATLVGAAARRDLNP